MARLRREVGGISALSDCHCLSQFHCHLGISPWELCGSHHNYLCQGEGLSLAPTQQWGPCTQIPLSLLLFWVPRELMSKQQLYHPLMGDQCLFNNSLEKAENSEGLPATLTLFR